MQRNKTTQRPASALTNRTKPRKLSSEEHDSKDQQKASDSSLNDRASSILDRSAPDFQIDSEIVKEKPVLEDADSVDSYHSDDEDAADFKNKSNRRVSFAVDTSELDTHQKKKKTK